MVVNEIFGSIDGEGIRAGELATFVRTAGCPLRCAYCDTKYALGREDGIELGVNEVVQRVHEIGYRNVTITGGEPLAQRECLELVGILAAGGYSVNVETSGALDISGLSKMNCIITMDWKTPFSRMDGKMLEDNLLLLREHDVLKIVMAKSDEEYVRGFLTYHRWLPCWLYLSPVFGEIEYPELVEFFKSLHNDGLLTMKSRVQVQLHKIIWDPEMRGV